MAAAKKYGEKAKKMVKRAMEKLKKGTLKSSSGEKVTSRKQAIAIGLSEARAKGGKVPSKKNSSGKQRPAAKRGEGRKKTTKARSSK